MSRHQLLSKVTVDLRHAAGRVTFKLVAKAGGEAIADTHWTVQTADGVLVKESLGALPTHLLQAGNYVVIARQGAASHSQPFKLAAGDVAQVEVVMK